MMKRVLKPDHIMQRVILAAIMVTFVISGVLYALSTPLLEVSDELRHYYMIEHLAQGKGLPVQNPAKHGLYEQEGSQPPLYYALMALVALPFDRSDLVSLTVSNPHARSGRADATNNWNLILHTDAEQLPWRNTVLVTQIIRFISLLMGACAVLCVYEFARELTGALYGQGDASIVIPLTAAAFTAFNPMFVFISASVNNDNLSVMLASMALLLGARAITRGLTWRGAALLGVVIGCATLAKASGLALVLAIPPAILVSEWLRVRSVSLREAIRAIRTQLLMLALMLALIAVIGGWWYVRNAILYNGDFTGTTMMATIAGARDALPSPNQLISEWSGFQKSYWGLFGAVNIPIYDVFYDIMNFALALAGVGLLWMVFDFARALRAADQETRVSLWRMQALPVLMGFGAFFIAFVALIRWTSITLASQGRLLFPVIAVISTLMAIGLYRLLAAALKLFGKLRVGSFGARLILPALLIGMAVLTMISPTAYIQPAYATPLRITESDIPDNFTKTELYFGDSIRWIGYQTHTERAQPGQEFIVTLYWQGLKPMPTNYSAFIRLFGRDDREILVLDTYPGGGMFQTTRWQPGQVIADRYRLRIPQTATVTQAMPTVLRLDVGYWNFETKKFLDTFDASGAPTGRQRYEVGSLAILSADAQTAGAHLQLSRVTNTDVTRANNTLTFIVTWAATADFTEDYTVFAHLFNAADEKVAQADGRADSGNFSARWWRQGDRITDAHIFELPANLPPGDYVIRFGLYRPRDGQRMPAFDAQGQPIPDMALSQPVTIK